MVNQKKLSIHLTTPLNSIPIHIQNGITPVHQEAIVTAMCPGTHVLSLYLIEVIFGELECD